MRFRIGSFAIVIFTRTDWLASVDISRFYLRLAAGKGLRRVQWVQDPATYGSDAQANKSSLGRRWRQLQAVGFGLKTAPAWASVVSAELVRIFEADGIRVLGCFIDDILIAGSSKEDCQRALSKALRIMESLGLPANDKTEGPMSPSEGIVFLGVHVQPAHMRFTVSEEHRQYALDQISTVLKNKTATKKELASIAGVLTWISFVHTPGRPRCQCIYDSARLGSAGKKSDVVSVRGPVLRQLRWWHALVTDWVI
mgnify:CR=1 FL=1